MTMLVTAVSDRLFLSSTNGSGPLDHDESVGGNNPKHR